MGRLTMMHAVGLAIGALASVSPALAADDDIELPQTPVWKAYDIGSTGYSQAVGIGAALKNNPGANLRVRPGKNGVSPLVPPRADQAAYYATRAERHRRVQG